MQSLTELLLLPDLKNKIVSTKKYIVNAKKYAQQMKMFTPVFEQNWKLPLLKDKYSGKIAHVDWVLYDEELYLCLNVIYRKAGLIKCCEVLSSDLKLIVINDTKRVKTLSGKSFKRRVSYNKDDVMYSISTDKLIPQQPFAIISNGMEHFANRDKILSRFNNQMIA